MNGPYLILVLFTSLAMMIIPSFGQENDKKTLIIPLPDTHRWTADPLDESDFWGVHYKGFAETERYPSIEIQQTNMFHQHILETPQEIADRTTALLRNFDDTAALQLRKQQKIDGDHSMFYTISTAQTTVLLFFRQSKMITHRIELELHEDQLKLFSIDRWENIFFNSRISE